MYICRNNLNSKEMETKKPIGKAQFIYLLSKGLSDFYGREVTFSAVQDQLFLIEMGCEPTDLVIATWINEYATKDETKS